MSGRLGITQRVDVVDAYGERRDCLDQRWAELAASIGMTIAPLSNIPPERAAELLDGLDLAALILSGGNSLSAADPDAPDCAPERDAFEAAAIQWALQHDVPVLGVCRGMQMLNVWFGGSLEKIDGHAGTHHAVSATGASPLPTSRTVNSYHNWGISIETLAENLDVLAQHEDGSIEAFRHRTHRVDGIMWHPERETPFNDEDLEFLRSFVA
ncbi:MAG: gamma-glutamyl-gamma-aminobutyrate hydrolase family protein [Woeseiaceae bacterium]|nr:gamma-glutamyl-gamma-aminobutyrate hydrolase family protein [Woeseiaceae bacterium]